MIEQGSYTCHQGSPRVEGDDEEDVNDIEHEFNIDDHEHNRNNSIAEAKMSYGKGPEDDDNAQYPPVIAGRSRHVSGEFPLSTQPHGEQMLSSLHKRVHPYGSPENEVEDGMRRNIEGGKKEWTNGKCSKGIWGLKLMMEWIMIWKCWMKQDSHFQEKYQLLRARSILTGW